MYSACYSEPSLISTPRDRPISLIYAELDIIGGVRVLNNDVICNDIIYDTYVSNKILNFIIKSSLFLSLYKLNQFVHLLWIVLWFSLFLMKKSVNFFCCLASYIFDWMRRNRLCNLGLLRIYCSTYCRSNLHCFNAVEWEFFRFQCRCLHYSYQNWTRGVCLYFSTQIVL